MSDVTKRQDKINDFEVSGNRPIGESLMHKISGDINYLIDETQDVANTATQITSRNVGSSGVGPFIFTVTGGPDLVAQCSLVPSQSNVGIFLGGYDPGRQLLLQLRRTVGGNEVVVREFFRRSTRNNQGFQPLAFANYFDINATPGTTNTYSLWIQSLNFLGISQIRSPSIHVVEVG